MHKTDKKYIKNATVPKDKIEKKRFAFSCQKLTNSVFPYAHLF